MQILSGARKMLLSEDTVNGFVAGKVWKQRLEEKLEGTSGVAIVLTLNGGWVTPDTVQTVRFPLLRVDSYADPTREPSGEIARLDAEDKAGALQEVCDRVMHAQRGKVWGGPNGLLVVACVRNREPVLYTHDDGHGGNLQTGNKNLGDLVYVRTEYALTVA